MRFCYLSQTKVYQSQLVRFQAMTTSSGVKDTKSFVLSILRNLPHKKK